jgi:hypothetical protein
MVRRAIVVLAWVGSGLGCSFDSSPTSLAGCVEGQSAECACADGARGVQSCADGEYAECACGVASAPSATAGSGDQAAINGSTVPSPGGASSDGPGGGAGGSSGGGSGGRASGDSGGGGGGSGGSGGAGTLGSAGAAGSAGVGGSGGDAGKAGGQAGSAVDPGEPAKPGELYGACSAQGDCQDGRICYTLSIDGSVTGYCAPACTIASSGTSLGACEQPESGKVRAQCAPLIGLCLLGTCENTDCPTGMDCVETTSAFGQAGESFDCRFRRP